MNPNDSGLQRGGSAPYAPFGSYPRLVHGLEKERYLGRRQ